MRSLCESLKTNVFDSLPLTYHIKTGSKDPEFLKFLEYFDSQNKIVQEAALNPKATKRFNLWIVKPGENTNRGSGIKVVSDLESFKQIIDSTQNLNPKLGPRTYIIQQYLERPLLYNKRKFDIRCYQLLTSVNGLLKGYWYQDGYVRTASKEFSLKNLTKGVHLTNDAVQKKEEGYGKYEKSNKLSFEDLNKYISANFPNVDFYTDIYPQMKNLSRQTIQSVYGKINPSKRDYSFEIFGLDFMIDENFKVWLIEVNTNPDIEICCPVLARVIPNMLENAFRIAVDPVFPPPSFTNPKKLPANENYLETNKFEIIFDEIEDGPALNQLNRDTINWEMMQIDEEEGEEEREDDEN